MCIDRYQFRAREFEEALFARGFPISKQRSFQGSVVDARGEGEEQHELGEEAAPSVHARPAHRRADARREHTTDQREQRAARRRQQGTRERHVWNFCSHDSTLPRSPQEHVAQI